MSFQLHIEKYFSFALTYTSTLQAHRASPHPNKSLSGAALQAAPLFDLLMPLRDISSAIPAFRPESKPGRAHGL